LCAADILGLNKPWAQAQPQISLELEVDQYLSDSNHGSGTLQFWMVAFSSKQSTMMPLLMYSIILQEHQQQYPHIFKLAMDIIPIQASSVPCEHVFSSGKETMSP